jgi:hypothetical protein
MNAIEAKASNGQPYNEALNLTRRFAPRRLTPARYKARVLTWKVWHGQIQLVRDAVKPVTVHRTLGARFRSTFLGSRSSRGERR